MLEADEITLQVEGRVKLAIHRDGTTEVGGEPGPRIEPNGVVSFAGAPAAQVAIDGAVLDLRTGKPTPFALAGDLLTVDGNGADASLRLTADGTLTMPGAAPAHVHGANTQAKRHAVLAVLALTLGLAQRTP